MKRFRKAEPPNAVYRMTEIPKTGSISDILGEEESYNRFYDSVSVVFRIASFVLIAAFLFYIVASAFNNANDFSYENLEFIVRNFALTLDENKDANIYSIEYNPDTHRSYSLFGKGLSICGNSGITIYSATGRQTCSKSFPYKNPVMTSSEKYALVYDYGDNVYTLYNSFTDVYTSELAKDIRGAAIADNGNYALITSSDEYTSTVEVYNNNFALVNRFNIHDYVIDTDINDRFVLTASVSLNDSYSYTTELLYCEIGTSQAQATVTIDNDFPVACHITPQGFMAVCKNSAIFFDSHGELIGKYIYPSSQLIDFAVSGEFAVLLFKENGFDLKYHLVNIASSGSEVYAKEFTTTVFDVELYGRKSYILTDRNILSLDVGYEAEVDFAGGNSDCKLLAYSENLLYVCTPTAAPLVEFSKFNGKK